jgi:ligand-binding SRPBCC domain-containing protein
MPIYNFAYTVDASLEALNRFYNSPLVLRKLTPLPVFVQLHDFGPLEEGMMARFTLWFGPFPLRWRAEHINVSPYGFTDVQWEGPLETWRHTRQSVEESAERTTIYEQVEYSHKAGWRGVISRLLFNRFALWYMFSFRKEATQIGIR